MKKAIFTLFSTLFIMSLCTNTVLASSYCDHYFINPKFHSSADWNGEVVWWESYCAFCGEVDIDDVQPNILKISRDDTVNYFEGTDYMVIAKEMNFLEFFAETSADFTFEYKKDSQDIPFENSIATMSRLSVYNPSGYAGGYTFIVLGDVNCDGKVTIKDARKALRFAAHIETPNHEAIFLAANVFNDSRITISAARKILRVAAMLDSFSI